MHEPICPICGRTLRPIVRSRRFKKQGLVCPQAEAESGRDAQGGNYMRWGAQHSRVRIYEPDDLERIAQRQAEAQA